MSLRLTPRTSCCVSNSYLSFTVCSVQYPVKLDMVYWSLYSFMSVRWRYTVRPDHDLEHYGTV